jgi:foldase protein PrsA
VNTKKILCACLGIIAALSISGCSMIEKTPEAIKNSVVATVNGEKITRGELDSDPNTLQLIEQVKQQYGDNYSENDEAMEAIKIQKETILDNMITEKLLAQKAKELNLLPSESKVKADAETQINNMKKQYFDNDETKFKEALKNQGLTENSLKNMYIDQVRNQEIQENITKSLTKNLKITDKQVEDYYNNNKDSYREYPTKMHLAHILVKTEDEAKKVKARLDKGESFSEVAKDVSLDDSNKDNGGDLGEISADDTNYDAQFMAGATALNEGEISDPVQSSFGWHIIKCIKKTIYPVKDFSEVKDEIKTKLENEQKTSIVQKKIAEWKKAADIEKKEKNII